MHHLICNICLGVYFGNFNKNTTITNNDNKNDSNNKTTTILSYVRNTKWLPNPEDYNIEGKLNLLYNELTKAYNKLPRSKHFNLTKHKQYTLLTLKKCLDLIIGKTDKNVGPFIAP